MEPMLVDEGLDLGQFGDLMDQRFGIVANEPLAATAAGNRLAVERLADLLGRHQVAVELAMPGLAAAFLPPGRSRGFTLHSNRIGRGRLGRVGGVELEPRFEVTDPCCQFVDPLLHRRGNGDDGRLCVGRHLGPKFIRDGQWVGHNDGIGSSSTTFNPRL